MNHGAQPQPDADDTPADPGTPAAAPGTGDASDPGTEPDASTGGSDSTAGTDGEARQAADGGSGAAAGAGDADPGAAGSGDAANTGDTESSDGTPRFQVRLANFEGPFDLLLQLISQHQLDVTEVALHQVTDDFIAHTRSLGQEWDLDETTEFLVVAATLLDLKAARLLPSAEVEDEDDLALLEARDLLFARVLQYRAYKQVAALFGELEAGALRRYPRSVSLEERYLGLLPEVMLGVTPDRFADVALGVFRPKPAPEVSLDHLHMGKVSVREHAAVLRIRLAEQGEGTFRDLVADCEHTLEVVARFLALLELYREKSVNLEQEEALGELHVRWTGGSVEEATARAEADRAADTDDEEYG
ncbi:segregation and condensation protein A [Prauserella sediminis]|uniref:Segregation and condensation protein A n=1 Tax=Prauserella sediminis TaxID=577680 RepID=A0A839XZ69_9PSEU|nr:segregation/condensation protein A [Prauserella sediminis]MBB3665326.1 segregation and condensation protein A [Prauserella sediminis]